MDMLTFVIMPCMRRSVIARKVSLSCRGAWKLSSLKLIFSSSILLFNLYFQLESAPFEQSIMDELVSCTLPLPSATI